jgi:FkbM family methyltransferase
MNKMVSTGQALLRLAYTSVNYDLRQRSERSRSASDLRELFIDITATLDRPIFLECGANDAALSRRMRKKVPHCEVIAFEANPETFRTFGARHDFMAEGVDYRNLALAAKDGRIPFRMYTSIGDEKLAKTDGRHSLLLRHVDSEYVETEIEARTLDGLFEHQADRRFSILIDVEGATHLVLAGATELLKRTDVLIIEVEAVPYWQGQWLAGDVVRFLEERGMHPIARDFEYREQYNLVFVREDALESGSVIRNIERHCQRAVLRDAN